MAFKPHTSARIRELGKRFSEIAKSLDEIADEMDLLKCESVDLQSESVVNHRLVPLEDWIYRVRGYAQRQLRKARQEHEAFLLGQQYAAEKAAAAAAAAQKPAKSPGKRSSGGKK